MLQNEALLYPHDRFMRPLVALVPRWVTPNSITVFRFFITPFVLWLLWIESYSWGTIWFFIAAFSDALDGSVARLRNQITKWGIFYDPIADKLLMGSVLLLIALRFIAWWIVALVVVMEVSIAIGAIVRRGKGKINQANIWGKIKMLMEFVALMVLLVGVQDAQPIYVEMSQYLLLLALVFGGISYATYSP